MISRRYYHQGSLRCCWEVAVCDWWYFASYFLVQVETVWTCLIWCVCVLRCCVSKKSGTKRWDWKTISQCGLQLQSVSANSVRFSQFNLFWLPKVNADSFAPCTFGIDNRKSVWIIVGYHVFNWKHNKSLELTSKSLASLLPSDLLYHVSPNSHISDIFPLSIKTSMLYYVWDGMGR